MAEPVWICTSNALQIIAIVLFWFSKWSLNKCAKTRWCWETSNHVWKRSILWLASWGYMPQTVLFRRLWSLSNSMRARVCVCNFHRVCYVCRVFMCVWLVEAFLRQWGTSLGRPDQPSAAPGRHSPARNMDGVNNAIKLALVINASLLFLASESCHC